MQMLITAPNTVQLRCWLPHRSAEQLQTDRVQVLANAPIPMCRPYWPPTWIEPNSVLGFHHSSYHIGRPNTVLCFVIWILYCSCVRRIARCVHRSVGSSEYKNALYLIQSNLLWLSIIYSAVRKVTDLLCPDRLDLLAKSYIDQKHHLTNWTREQWTLNI